MGGLGEGHKALTTLSESRTDRERARERAKGRRKKGRGDRRRRIRRG